MKTVTQKKKKEPGTFDHFPGVIDNTLVILVRSMRKVHADYNETLVGSPITSLRSGQTDIDTSTTKLAELLHAIDLGT